MTNKPNFFMQRFDAEQSAAATPADLKVIEPTAELQKSAALFAARMERQALESAKKNETEVSL